MKDISGNLKPGMHTMPRSFLMSFCFNDNGIVVVVENIIIAKILSQKKSYTDILCHFMLQQQDILY